MGLFFGLLLSGMVVYGAYRFAVSPAARVKALQDFARAPFFSLWVLVGVLCCLGFLWGILVRPFGLIEIGGGVRLVQAAGVGALLWFLSLLVAGAVVDYRRRKKRR